MLAVNLSNGVRIQFLVRGIEGDQLLGIPDDVNCQIPFFTWVIYGDEVFVPLPDVEIVHSGH